MLPGTRPRDALRARLPALHDLHGPHAVQAFGEAGVQTLVRSLSAAGSDLLILAWPATDSGSTALGLCALEAARRMTLAVALVGWPEGRTAPCGADDQPLPGALLLPGSEICDAWADLWAAAPSSTLPERHAAVPTVSVIVRSMDRPTLSAALQSVGWQTWPDLGVVVINAAGPGHRDIASFTGDPRVQMVAVPDGAALPRARAANVGLQAARGRWLMFLDDDDPPLPGWRAALRRTTPIAGGLGLLARLRRARAVRAGGGRVGALPGRHRRHSEVFVASDLASRSLAHVLAKWQPRSPTAHWVGIVERLLQAQRLEQHAQQRLAASLEACDSLRAVLEARDVEIGNLRHALQAATQSQRESPTTPPAPGALAAWSHALAGAGRSHADDRLQPSRCALEHANA